MSVIKKLTSILLSGIIATTSLLNVYADDVTTASNTSVTIEIETGAPSIGDNGPLDDSGNIISLTVPSVLPFIFNKNGTTTVPTDWTIKNYDTDSIKVENIYFEPREDWKIHQVQTNQLPGEYLLNKSKDYKEIEVFIGEMGKNNAVSIGDKIATNNISSINMIIPGINDEEYTSKTLEFKVYRTPFTIASEELGAYTMHIDFGFYESANTINKEIFNTIIKDKPSIYFGGDERMLNDPNADDLSEIGDKSIVGLDINGKYHIISDDTVYAPEDSSYLFADCIAETIVFGEYFDTSTATTLEGMFDNCSNLKSITLGKNFGQENNIPSSGLFNTGSTSLTIVNGNDLIKGYDYSLDNINITTKFNYINKTKLQDIMKDAIAVYFEYQDNHEVLTNNSAVDLSEAQDNSIMATKTDNKEVHIVSHATIYISDGVRYLFRLENLKKLKFNNFDTSNLTSIDRMFYGCGVKEIDISNFNTANVTNMALLFDSCQELEYINFGDSFDTSKVTNMSQMFQDCHKLVNLDIRMFNDTSKVININSMFNGCYMLEDIDLSNFDTSNCMYMNDTFNNCRSLTSLDLSNFNTNNTTDMVSMFIACYNLENIIFGDNFVTNKVTRLNEMFKYCHKLTTLDLSNFDTSNVVNIYYMAFDCPQLKTIIVNENFNFDINNAKTSSSLFYVDNLTPLTIVNPSESILNYDFISDNREVTFVYDVN